MQAVFYATILALGFLSTFRVNVAHDGVFPATNARNYAGLQWRVETDGAVHATPAVSGRLVVTGSDDGYVYAIDAVSGSVRWRFHAAVPVDSTAAIEDGTAYVADRSGTTYAIVVASGRLRWKALAGAPLPLEFSHDNYSTWSSSPTVAAGIVLVGARDGYLRALKASTGATLWRLKTGGQIESTPAVSNDTVYVGSLDGRLYAARLRSGALVWTFSTRASTQISSRCHFDCHSIRSSPAVSGSTVVFGVRDGFLYAVDATSGRERWRVDHQTAWVNASPAIFDGIVYDADSSNQRIEAVDLQNGKVQWQYKAESLVFASPAIVGSVLYECDFSGNLLALDRATGTLLWKRRGSANAIVSSPVIENDRVYVGSDDGSLYAFNLTAGPALKKAVFFDAQHPKVANYSQAISGIGPEQVRDYFASRGYDVLDEDSLLQFLNARSADRAASVIVFATDYLPDNVAPSDKDTGAFRRYLDTGGKVVWPGFSPLLFHRDLTTGAPTGVNLVGLQTLLGVTYGALSEPMPARPTPEGARWGLRGGQITRSDVVPAGVTALAIDDRRMAGAWVKRYSGVAGSGFVSLPALGFDGLPDADVHITMNDVQSAAEYFPKDT